MTAYRFVRRMYTMWKMLAPSCKACILLLINFLQYSTLLRNLSLQGISDLCQML